MEGNKHFVVVAVVTAESDLDKALVVVAAAAAAAAVVVGAGFETGLSIGEAFDEKQHPCTESRCARDPDTAANGLGLC